MFDQSSKLYSIKITGEGYSIEDKISKSQLNAIFSIITTDNYTPFQDINLNNDLTKIAPKKSKKKHSKSAPGTPVLVNEALENMQIDPVSELYGNYWTIKAKSDRIMWILAALNEKNFEYVNQKEISFIAKKLADDIPTKSITALLEAHKKGGRIAPSLMGTVRTVRILKPGLDYVKNLSEQNTTI